MSKDDKKTNETKSKLDEIFVFEKERIFKTKDRDEKKITLKIVRPTNEQSRKSDLYYKAKFSEAIQTGVMTRAQAERFIREKKLLDDKTLTRFKEIADEINSLRDSLGSISIDEKSKGIETINKIRDLRTEMDSINDLSAGILEQTAESYADEFRVQWLCSELTLKEDDTKFFSDYEEFDKLMDSQAVIDSVRNLIFFMNNIRDNYETVLEENKWLIDNKIMNEDMSINVDNLVESVKKPKKVIKNKTNKNINKKPKKTTTKK